MLAEDVGAERGGGPDPALYPPDQGAVRAGDRHDAEGSYQAAEPYTLQGFTERGYVSDDA